MNYYLFGAIIFVSCAVIFGSVTWVAVVASLRDWRPFYKMISRIREERNNRRAWEQAKQVFAQRPRARILEAGQILTLSDGREIAIGFTLDCRGIIPAYSRGPDGEYLIGGYTSAELLEIARRPSEFVEIPE